MNINILGISELKWTGMGEFKSDDQYICYCGQESLRRNGVAIIVNKSPKCSTWAQVNTEIRLILFFAAKDGEALYSQQKQDWELIVAQIMNFLLPNSYLN